MRSLRADALEEISLLYDFYGGLLTQKQREAMELHFQMDLSLGEIAENEGVSRQAVHDVIRRSTAALRAFERELGLVAKYRDRRRQLEQLSREVAVLKRAWLDGDASGAAARTALMRAERLVYALLQE